MVTIEEVVKKMRQDSFEEARRPPLLKDDKETWHTRRGCVRLRDRQRQGARSDQDIESLNLRCPGNQGVGKKVVSVSDRDHRWTHTQPR